MKKFLLPLISVWVFLSCSSPENKSVTYPPIDVKYPHTKKVDQVDDYFGTQVSDPYRWLEDDLSEETASWVESQNQVTFAYLNQIPFRDQIKSRIEKLWNYEKVGSPTKHGNYYYFYKNDGLQNQYVLYRKKELDSKESEVFIDPNKFSSDGTISMSGSGFTKDGSLMAYLISESGSDWNKIIIKDTESLKILGS